MTPVSEQTVSLHTRLLKGRNLLKMLLPVVLVGTELWHRAEPGLGPGRWGAALLQALEHTTFDKGRINEAHFP